MNLHQMRSSAADARKFLELGRPVPEGLARKLVSHVDDLAAGIEHDTVDLARADKVVGAAKKVVAAWNAGKHCTGGMLGVTGPMSRLVAALANHSLEVRPPSGKGPTR